MLHFSFVQASISLDTLQLDTLQHMNTASVEAEQLIHVQANLVPEEWGGTVPFVSISAKKGMGIEELLETVALVAEVEELQANPERAAVGTVLEAHLNRQVGPVATLLVQAGTLRVRFMSTAHAVHVA